MKLFVTFKVTVPDDMHGDDIEGEFFGIANEHHMKLVHWASTPMVAK